jgi:hypothetical protein
MNNIKTSVILSFLSFFFFSVAINAQGLSVDNGRLFFKGAPGEQQSQELTISNPTDKKVIVQIAYQDWVRDEYGTKNYAEAGSMKKSCAPWTSVKENTIELAPMSEKIIQVEMTPPAGLTAKDGVHNSMLFLKQIKDPYERVAADGKLKSSISATFQIGVHLYYIHPSLSQQELSIQGFQFEESNSESGPVFLIKLENIGETLVDSSIKLELTDKSSGKEYRPLDAQPLTAAFMPADVRYVSIDLPQDIPAGKYSALAIVDTGAANDLQMAMIDVEIPNK